MGTLTKSPIELNPAITSVVISNRPNNCEGTLVRMSVPMQLVVVKFVDAADASGHHPETFCSGEVSPGCARRHWLAVSKVQAGDASYLG